MPRARRVVLALCVAFVWAGFRPEDPASICPIVRDDVATHVEPRLWPPGTLRCEFGGFSSTYVPWREWLVLAAFVACFL